MPRDLLFDISKLDLGKVIVDKAGIYAVNPHRYEFQQLDGLVHLDLREGTIAGYRDVRSDEFWVRGHIPGRPIFPGVLMIETAAQLVNYLAMRLLSRSDFMGFAGVDKVKFRDSVVPGQKILMLGKMLEIRTRRCIGATQAYVDGTLVYEGLVTGMWV